MNKRREAWKADGADRIRALTSGPKGHSMTSKVTRTPVKDSDHRGRQIKSECLMTNCTTLKSYRDEIVRQGDNLFRYRLS